MTVGKRVNDPLEGKHHNKGVPITLRKTLLVFFDQCLFVSLLTITTKGWWNKEGDLPRESWGRDSYTFVWSTHTIEVENRKSSQRPCFVPSSRRTSERTSLSLSDLPQNLFLLSNTKFDLFLFGRLLIYLHRTYDGDLSK